MCVARKWELAEIGAVFAKGRGRDRVVSEPSSMLLIKLRDQLDAVVSSQRKDLCLIKLIDFSWPRGGVSFFYPSHHFTHTHVSTGYLLEVSREQPTQLLLRLLTAPLRAGNAAGELRLPFPMLSLHEICMLLLAQLVQYSTDESSRVLRVGLHIPHHHLDRHITRIVPAVVVRAHANHLVSNLCLPRQLCFRQRGHVDHTATPAAVHIALRPSRELRSLHADNRALVMKPHAVSFQTMSAFPHNLSNLAVEGVREPHVPHHASFEERERANALGAVDDLVGHNEVPRFDRLLQASDCGESNDSSHAYVSECGDVGAGRDFVGSDFVVQAMAGQKGDWDGLAGGWGRVVKHGDGRGGCAPGSRWLQGRDMSEVREGLQAGAADDCD